MYNNSTHYPNTAYQSAYPQYQQSYGGNYGYQEYGTQYTDQNRTTHQPAPPGEGFPSDNWSVASAGTSYGTPQDAVAQEMQQQKAQLAKQREDYVRKVSVLRHELEQLRMQKQELVGDGTSDRDLGNILRENDKLQEEIQGKMKAIHNVIEMLSSIIKDGRTLSDLEASLMAFDNSQSPATPKVHGDSHGKPNGQSPEPGKTSPERYCYVHYDTGLHWCRMCDEFPETAKDFLLHLQDKKHREMAKENDIDNTPWHKLPAEPVLPSEEGAPKKRVPIKGDLHCASHHLKSQTHFQNYENFVVQNPHWEMEWLKDREKAMSRNGIHDSSDSEGKKKKKKRKDKRHAELFAMKEKKKKKRSKKRRKHSSDSSSSSSSSDSSSDEDKADRSRSIRVAMRNIKQVQSIMEEDLTSKWSVLERLVEEHKKNEEKKEKDKKDKESEKVKEPEDPLINQWMTVSQPQEKDKRLLENLKDRMKQKQEMEKARQIEMEKRRQEKEREERETREREEREAREAAEEAERVRKRKEQEEFERIRDKERHQVRFRTNYRRRRESSRSDEEDSPHHDKHSRHERYSESRSETRSETRSEASREKSRSRSRSIDRKVEESAAKKKPPGPPSYKKLPFIGRMPLFKNKKPEEKEERKEIKKESYEVPRRTRFQPGTLARAFIPKPDVCCFPKLSSIPPLTIPPPPTVSPNIVAPPDPPKISHKTSPKVPPPPKIAKQEEPSKVANLSDDEMLYADPGEGVDASMMGQYYQEYNMMYSHNYDYQQEERPAAPDVPHSHTMPLPPPPLPPDDDLALLGICADDMAAQSF